MGALKSVTIQPLYPFPLVSKGDDLAELLLPFLRAASPTTEDVLVVAHKIFSKVEGRCILLSDVKPSSAAYDLAKRTEKDPRVVELILRESIRVVRAEIGVLIVEHRLGFIHANAGIDHSNVGAAESVLLLPQNPQKSALDLALRLATELGFELPIIMNDTMGRPWRKGVVGNSIAAVGIKILWDLCDTSDLDGRALQHTELAVSDELAAAASFAMGQSDEAIPAVLVHGVLSGKRSALRLPLQQSEDISVLFRKQSQDLFR